MPTKWVRPVFLLSTLLLSTVSAVPALSVQAAPQKGVRLTPIGSYVTGVFDKAAAEIVAHDPGRQQVFVVNAQAATVDVLDIQDPREPVKIHTIDVKPHGAVANSIAIHDGLIA